MIEERDMILIGEKVCLGPRRRDLLPEYLRWANDPEVNCYLQLWGAAMSLEDEEKWYESTGGPHQRVLTVYCREDIVPIGNTGLHGIDFRHGTAELGIMLGEKEHWGRGLGTEATQLMLDYGFTGLGLHCIQLRALACNARAIRCYEKAGFRMAGRIREFMRVGGQRFDYVMMDILASEFTSPVLGPMLQEKGLRST
ncbi:MAG: GNAT family protein [Bacillota bacterium]